MKKILISGLKTNSANYVNAVMGVWAEPVLRYCPDPALAAECDGLILCGGEDIDPAYYEQGMEGTQEMDLDRDRAEFAVLKAFLDAEKPVLGICRGLQLLNVALGGTLIQDLGPEGNLFHRRGGDNADRVHPVRSKPGSIFDLLYGPVFAVNSSHHQALGTLAPALEPVLWSESGIVEGAVLPGKPVLAVQFHPERMSFANRRADTVDGAAIFRYFLSLIP